MVVVGLVEVVEAVVVVVVAAMVGAGAIGASDDVTGVGVGCLAAGTISGVTVAVFESKDNRE